MRAPIPPVLPPQTPRPETLILIHGAWQGGWAWDHLLPELARCGLSALVLELPGNGFHPIAPNDVVLADYARTVCDAIDSVVGPVALVGHSGGGQCVTLGAEARPDRVARAIYIVGMLLPEGRSFGDVQGAIDPVVGSFGISPHVVVAPDGLTCHAPIAPAISHFYQDVAPDVAAAAAVRLTPQPMVGHRMRVATTPQRFGRVAKHYVEATQDRSIPLAAQRMMQGFVDDISVHAIATGHAPQLAAPAQLADILDGLCA